MRRLRRFGKAQSGATAIEFALLAGPFLVIVLGLIEIGIQYFTSTSFESAVQRSARLIRTGQAQAASMDLAALRSAVCGDIYNLFDCMNNTAFQVSILSSMTSVPTDKAVDEEGKFVIEDLQNIGEHYDPTLIAWWQNFHAAWPRLEEKYGPTFYRMWKYYLLGCAGGFRARETQLCQFVFTRVGTKQPAGVRAS